MEKNHGTAIGAIVLVLALCFVWTANGIAQEKKGMEGWELGSPYNRNYDAAELDRIRVTVVKLVTVEPMPGMAPGVGLVARERDAEDDIMVHICPEAFMKTSELGIKGGDQLKIRGCWAEIDGEDVFMAAKIKKGDYFSLKVRLTKDGTPFWTMSPEQLVKERASQ